MKKDLFFVGLVWTFCFPTHSLKLTILHTNDLHSHFYGSGPNFYFTSPSGDGDPVLGHYGRLSHRIQLERRKALKKGNKVLLIDAGDFYSGTVFHILAPVRENSFNPEMEFFHHLRYDAISLGNHEFDAKEIGFKNMLEKAQRVGLNVPIVASNLKWEGLPKTFQPFLVQGYGKKETGPFLSQGFIKELEGENGETLKVGFLGANGPDACLVSIKNRKDFKFYGLNSKNRPDISDLGKIINQRIKDLKEKGAEAFLLTLHGGNPEDIELARLVPDLDIIISGHTHKVYPRPIRIGKTIISQAGSYGMYLGRLELKWKEGAFHLSNEQKDTIITIDDSEPLDSFWVEKIERYSEAIRKRLNRDILEPVYLSNKNWEKKLETGNPYGKWVTSGILKKLNEKLDRPVDIYFTTLSMIRRSMELLEGKKTQFVFSDIFRILGMGLGKNFSPGYPIASFYLSKKDVYKVIEFLEIYSYFSPNFKPAFSNELNYEVRSWGIPMVNRLKNLTFNGSPYSKWPKFIRVASSEFVASYFDQVKSLSYGLLTLTPRNEKGEVIKKMEIFQDLKEYQLFTEFLEEEK